MKKHLLFLLVLACALFGEPLYAIASVSPPVAFQIFRDDFDGASLDPSKWIVSDNKRGYGLETFRAEHVSLSDGVLHLSCNANYDCGEISTVNAFNYGYMEVRAKVPKGQGFWPAFWALSANVNNRSRQEIDVVEDHGKWIARTYFNLHWGLAGAIQNAGSSYGYYTWDWTTDYHLYGADYRADRVDIYIDGVLRWTYPTTTLIYDPVRLLLSLSLSRDGTFGGAPDATTDWSRSFDVDWVEFSK